MPVRSPLVIPARRQARSPSLPGALIIAALITACSTVAPPPVATVSPPPASQPPATRDNAARDNFFALESPAHSRELVLFALGLLDTEYRFGGRNPEAGLDCSGMVSYIVEQISGRRLPHNAAQIAELTRPITLEALRPGDLVFFNTMNRRHSHMGIYVGDGRFIHAPSTRGKVRVERLHGPYFGPRIDGARTLISTS